MVVTHFCGRIQSKKVEADNTKVRATKSCRSLYPNDARLWKNGAKVPYNGK